MQVTLEKNHPYYQEGTFPVKLHQMLEAVSDSELGQYVYWDPNGLSFTIADPKQFANKIMGNFFNQTRYKSFQRQLNFYGFVRTCRGKIRGVYTHPLFRRDKPELCNHMKRLDSRDHKKECTFPSSSSKKLRKSSSLHPLPPHEIIIDLPVPAFDFPPTADMDFSITQSQQDSNNNNDLLYSMLFPQSVSSTYCKMGIESIQTQATSLETNSDCDSSMGTIDVMPSIYPSWEMNESFEDDLFQSV